DVGFVHPRGADVFTERTRLRQYRRFSDFGAPRRVVVEGIVVHGLVDAAVYPGVSLLIAFQPQRSDVHLPGAGRLGDGAPLAGTGVGDGDAGQQGAYPDAMRGWGVHDRVLSRYSASSACLGVSSSGSSAARASCTAEEGANRPIWRGSSRACGRMPPAWVSLPRCSSSARRARASATTAFGRPASAATCRPKLRLAGPSLTACMNTSESSCSTASRCTLAMPLPGS